MPAYEVKDQRGCGPGRHVVPLAVGAGNVIAVIVTAQDGETLADVHGDGDAGWIFADATS